MTKNIKHITFCNESSNLGDDIQTYAASKFFNSTKFVERERLMDISEDTEAIISGWFMTNNNNWPPSKKIKASFLSFHGNPKIVNSKHAEYYKQFEPIGCRDRYTQNLFNKIEVENYFSGCLTLTLPEYKGKRTDEIIVVDLLRTNYSDKYRKIIIDRIIPKSFKNKVTYFSHLNTDLSQSSFEERMKNTEKVLKKYSEAKLVVTSLIHCALPCLALGTPVLFVDAGFSDRGNRRSRFEGILELMNVCNDINIPFGKHNKINKLARTCRLHYLFKNRISTISEQYFITPKANPQKYKEIVEKFHSQCFSSEDSK